MTALNIDPAYQPFRDWLLANTEHAHVSHDLDGMDWAIMEWGLDNVLHDVEGLEAQIAAMAEAMERIDCAGCYAPCGLIYNHEIAAKVPDWWDDIDSAVDGYRDATGELPEFDTVGSMVWFAVEWRAHEIASLLRHVAGVEE